MEDNEAYIELTDVELLDGLESTILIALNWFKDDVEANLFNIAMADIIRISTLLSERYNEAHK